MPGILGKRKNYSRYYGTSLGQRRWKRRKLALRPYRMPYRGRYRKRKVNIPRYITPDQKLVKLKYHVCCHNGTPGDKGGTAWVPVCANDLVSPGPAGKPGIHSPMGFDQMMTLYERFCVVGSKIHVTIMPNGGGGFPSILGVRLKDNNTTESVHMPTQSETNEGLLERNSTYWKYAPCGGGGHCTTVTYKFGAKKFFHLKSVNEKSEGSSDTIWGNATTSPSQKAFFNVFAAPMNYDRDCDYYFRITVEYAVLLSGRKFFGQS